MPGLKGGALTEFDIRTRLTEVLQSRGLQGQALGAKLDETMSKLSRTELVQWAANPTWQGLKRVVGTRVTYISKPKKEIDPLTIRDPWMQALHEKDSAAQSTKPLDHQAPQVCLIPEVWQNEDGSTPVVLDRPQNGSTGIVLLNPQQYTSAWQDTSLPLSADELLLVVWPPIQPPPAGPACQTVTFPARLMTEVPTVTLLHGQAFQFPQRSSVSLLVEAYKEEVPTAVWEELLDRPMQVVKRHLESSAPFLGNWGTRYWSPKASQQNPRKLRSSQPTCWYRKRSWM